MKDQRIPALRRALDAVLVSLEATLRVRSWSGTDEIPEPLRGAAERLIERLRTADRLSKFTPATSALDAARAQAMSAAVRRLDAAYVAFHQASQSAPASAERAITALRDEIDLVKEGHDAWSAP
jgi:superfamily I DNA/RNA helicase